MTARAFCRAAEIMHVSVALAKRRMSSGRWPSTKPGRTRMMTAAMVQQVIDMDVDAGVSGTGAVRGGSVAAYQTPAGGMTWQGLARQGASGLVMAGLAWLGSVWHGRAGRAWQGMARHG